MRGAMSREQIERYLRNVVGLDVARVLEVMALPDAELFEVVRSYALERRDGK